VHKLVPPFEVVFVGDDGLLKELFETHTDIPLRIVKKEISISSTDIREAMLKNKDWKKYLSKSTIDYLEKTDSVERLRKIS